MAFWGLMRDVFCEGLRHAVLIQDNSVVSG